MSIEIGTRFDREDNAGDHTLWTVLQINSRYINGSPSIITLGQVGGHGRVTLRWSILNGYWIDQRATWSSGEGYYTTWTPLINRRVGGGL